MMRVLHGKDRHRLHVMQFKSWEKFLWNVTVEKQYSKIIFKQTNNMKHQLNSSGNLLRLHEKGKLTNYD